MKVDDLQYYQQLQDLEQRVTKLESYHKGITAINIGALDNSQGEWKDYMGDYEEHTISVSVEPTEYSNEELTITNNNPSDWTVEWSKQYSQIKIKAKDNFGGRTVSFTLAAKNGISATKKIYGFSTPWSSPEVTRIE